MTIDSASDRSSQEETDTQRGNPPIDRSTLLKGGLATSFVAALIAMAGVLTARGFHVALLASNLSSSWTNANPMGYVLLAFLAGLIATGIVAILLASSAPAPYRFFYWIVALATAAVTIAPFGASGGLAPQFATAATNLLVGIAICSLTASAAHRSSLYPWL